MVLVIDNYDSFTWNLVHYLRELEQQVTVFRNDEISLQEISCLAPEHLLISPGPCTPNEAGISLQAITEFAGKLPILGVCLGHQAIGQALGGKVVRARKVMHGKTSAVYHSNIGVFQGLPNPLKVTRYHSLVLDPLSLPSDLEITAWTEDEQGQMDEVMGIRHKYYPLEGVQFHPEAILTQEGHGLLANFLAMKRITTKA
ncbi:MAG: aminodeoxychorismate/anthranilate synthase component II [Oceanospirillales bacterium]|nr:MAG: aminodeoxychorismate/anthranilate synthase component II [Oceanospirillales bacterium]